MKNNKKGFTLLELLVVVLIIGILATIALPQYKMAVGKTKFSELKTITKAVQQSAQRYYMTNGTYNLKAKDLDLDLDITGGEDDRSFYLRGGIRCEIWSEGSQQRVMCQKTIFKKTMQFFVHRENGRPVLCTTNSLDKNDNSNKLCQKETGKTASQARCNGGYCNYNY